MRPIQSLFSYQLVVQYHTVDIIIIFYCYISVESTLIVLLLQLVGSGACEFAILGHPI